jgi:hypothetical protein
MNVELALQRRAERGTVRGADAVWAAAQRRHRHQRPLIAVALILFILVTVAALVVARRPATEGPAPFVTEAPKPFDSRASGPCPGQQGESAQFTGPAAPADPCIAVVRSGDAIAINLFLGGQDVGGFAGQICAASVDIGQAGSVRESNGVTYLFGDGTAETRSVRLAFADGSEVTAETVSFDSVPGGTFWVASIPDVDAVTAIERLDQEGATIAIAEPTGEVTCP